jgi:hypothetical protein
VARTRRAAVTVSIRGWGSERGIGDGRVSIADG